MPVGFYARSVAPRRLAESEARRAEACRQAKGASLSVLTRRLKGAVLKAEAKPERAD